MSLESQGETRATYKIQGNDVPRWRVVKHDIESVLRNIGKKPLLSAFNGVVGFSSITAPVSFTIDRIAEQTSFVAANLGDGEADFDTEAFVARNRAVFGPLTDEEMDLVKMPYSPSDYLAGDNQLGVERAEVSTVSPDAFIEYFQTRENLSGTEIFENDTMFAQLALQVKNLSDRGLNFHRRERGQGLGFTSADFAVLRNRNGLREAQRNGGLITRIGEDGNRRAWAIVEARDFEEVVWRSVDEFIRLEGKDPQDPASQNERQQMFNRIVYGDFGVRPWGYSADWRDVSDDFDTCTTFMSPAADRANQAEWARHTNFQVDLEKVDGIDQESVFNIDSNTSVLMTTVIETDQDGNPTFLRMEVHTLSNPADPLRPDEIVVTRNQGVRVHGARWIPCGPAPEAEEGQQTQQPQGEGGRGNEGGGGGTSGSKVDNPFVTELREEGVVVGAVDTAPEVQAVQDSTQDRKDETVSEGSAATIPGQS